MVKQYCLSGKPKLDNSDMVLKNPIFREKWLLQNDDIILDRKLGKVVFFSVMRSNSLVNAGN